MGLRWRWWQTWCALFLLPPSTLSVLPVFSSASLKYSPPLLPFELMCHFILCAWFLLFFSPLHPLYVLRSYALDVASCVYISVKSYWSHFHQPLFPHVSLFSPFPCHPYHFFCLHQRLDVVTPHSLFFSLSHSSLHSIFPLCKDFDALSTLSLTWIFCLSPCKHPLPAPL